MATVPPASELSAFAGANVMIVLPSLGLGGAERQAFYLARHLRTHYRADVRMVALTPYGGLNEQCEAAGISYEFFEQRHAYRSRLGHLNDLWRFIRFLRERRVQILLPYCMFQNVFCGLTWRLGGVDVCIWNQRDEGRERLDPWIEALAVGQIRRFISNSTHGADFVTNTLHVSAERVHVVHNGIELPTLSTAPPESFRKRLGLPCNAFVATMVANLHSKKDHATLVAAWRRVVDRLTPSGWTPHLLLAGAPGDQYEPLLEQAEALSLGDHVHFLGQVTNVDDLLRDVDLAVFSSGAEGLPNAVLEAMAHGRAVVATDYPGIREALGPAYGPLLAVPRDPDDLADKIVLAAQNPEMRAAMGALGRDRVEHAFSIDQMASKMTAIIASEWQSKTRWGRSAVPKIA